MSTQKDVTDSLHIQINMLQSARARHMTWANSTDVPEIAQLHASVIDLLFATATHCQLLLEAYHVLPDVGTAE
jgi:hypothetical protein